MPKSSWIAVREQRVASVSPHWNLLHDQEMKMLLPLGGEYIGQMRRIVISRIITRWSFDLEESHYRVPLLLTDQVKHQNCDNHLIAILGIGLFVLPGQRLFSNSPGVEPADCNTYITDEYDAEELTVIKVPSP